MKTLILSIIIAGLYGCGSKGNSGSDAASAPSLIGNWKSPCSDNSDVLMTYDDKTNTMRVSVYSDDCKTLVAYVDSKRSYSLAGQNIDYAFQSVMMTVVDQTIVDDFNSSKAFGKDNWALNVPQDVAGLSVDSTSSIYPKVGDKLFEIFKLSDSSLQFGDTSGADNGSTVELRPTTFDPIVLKKF